MTDFWQDIRFGLRLLFKAPTFTLVAVATLALSIGLNSTLFSWVEGLMFYPLTGVPEQQNIVAVAGLRENGSKCCNMSYPNFRDYRDRSQSLDGLFVFRLAPMNLSVSGKPEIVAGELVSGNYFDVLQVQPQLGRTFNPEEDRTPGSHPVAVIGDGLWRRKFDASPNIVGSTQYLNGRAFTVIGVAPRGFQGTFVGYALDVWVPTMMAETFMSSGNRFEDRTEEWLEGFARLKPAIRMATAQAELDNISRQLESEFPDINRGLRAGIYPLWRTPFGAVPILAPMFVVLGCIVGVVMLIACASLANLLLARGMSRSREIAVRLSLGATRSRVVRQLFSESLLIGLAGGIGGIVVAFWWKDLLPRFLPPTSVPIVMNGQIDIRVVLATTVVSLLSVVLFGLVPAMRATGAGGGRTRLRAALVVAQLAFSLVLLVCAGLLAQSVRNVQKVNLGFDEANMLLGSFNLSSGDYDENRGRVFIRQLLDRVRGIPGVTAATVARDLPMNIRGIGMTEILIDGYAPHSVERLFAGLNYVGPQYFRVMRSELLSGRDFNSTDDENAAAVCIVNAEMVRRFWPGQQAIGKRVRVLGRWAEVVGVAPDLQYGSIQQGPRPYIYAPVVQVYTDRLTLQARTSRDPASVAPALREAVGALDAQLLLTDVQSMTTFLGFATFGQRVGATLLVFFGGLALVLASVGLYGVVACVLRLRTREIGLRMALGATRREVLIHIMRNAGMLVAIGVALGAIMSVAAARILSSQLSGLGLMDPFVFAAASAALGLFAISAALLPAWRAVRIDPSVCLRQG